MRKRRTVPLSKFGKFRVFQNAFLLITNQCIRLQHTEPPHPPSPLSRAICLRVPSQLPSPLGCFRSRPSTTIQGCRPNPFFLFLTSGCLILSSCSGAPKLPDGITDFPICQRRQNQETSAQSTNNRKRDGLENSSRPRSVPAPCFTLDGMQPTASCSSCAPPPAELATSISPTTD